MCSLLFAAYVFLRDIIYTYVKIVIITITKTRLFIQKISPPKIENFQIKNSDIFHIPAQNIDCGYLLKPP